MLQGQILISIVAAAHLEHLKALSRKTFTEAFASGNTEENLQLYLNTQFTDEKLLSEIDHPDSVFYFAMSNELPVGYLKINFASAQTELGDQSGLEIERIYVLQDYYGSGAGKMLLDKAIQIALSKQLTYIWLGVWEENKRAIRFYEKNGFVKFDSHEFKLGEEIQTDIMMRLNLNSK